MIVAEKAGLLVSSHRNNTDRAFSHHSSPVLYISCTGSVIEVLDYHLPGMNGLDLYHRLHAQSAYADIPALFLSSDALQAVFQREHLAFPSKPFEIEDFFRRIETLLSG